MVFGLLDRLGVSGGSLLPCNLWICGPSVGKEVENKFYRNVEKDRQAFNRAIYILLEHRFCPVTDLTVHARQHR